MTFLKLNFIIITYYKIVIYSGSLESDRIPRIDTDAG